MTADMKKEIKAKKRGRKRIHKVKDINIGLGATPNVGLTKSLAKEEVIIGPGEFVEIDEEEKELFTANEWLWIGQGYVEKRALLKAKIVQALKVGRSIDKYTEWLNKYHQKEKELEQLRIDEIEKKEVRNIRYFTLGVFLVMIGSCILIWSIK